MDDAWKRKEVRKRKGKTERELSISEKRNWIVLLLEWNEIQYISLIYKGFYTHKIGSRTF